MLGRGLHWRMGKAESRGLREQGPGVPGRESSSRAHGRGASQQWQETGAALAMTAPAKASARRTTDTANRDGAARARRIPEATVKGPR